MRVRIDNVGAIFMAKNTATRTRHMDTRYYFVKDLQKEKKISVEFVRSEDNVSDVNTKNVSGDIHEKFLGVYTAEKSYLGDDAEASNKGGS